MYSSARRERRSNWDNGRLVRCMGRTWTVHGTDKTSSVEDAVVDRRAAILAAVGRAPRDRKVGRAVPGEPPPCYTSTTTLKNRIAAFSAADAPSTAFS